MTYEMEIYDLPEIQEKHNSQKTDPDPHSVFTELKEWCNTNPSLDIQPYISPVLGLQTDGRALIAQASDAIYGDLPVVRHKDITAIQAGDIIVYERPWSNSELWMLALTEPDEDGYVMTFCKDDGMLCCWNMSFSPKDSAAFVHILTRRPSYESREVTEESASDAIRAFQRKYPNWRTWDSQDYYTSPVFGFGVECASFAFLLSDYIFGYAEKRELGDGEEIRIGDVIELKNSNGETYHWAVITEILQNNIVRVAEGNYAGHIHYGRTLSLGMLQYNTIWTRYPEDKDTVKNCEKDASCPLNHFSDADTNAWYHDGVHYCLEKGLMNGIDDGAFEPYGLTSRAMLVTVLYRLEGEPEVGESNFDDVADGQWYSNAIAWAAENKIVEGYAGKFDPEGNISREAFATILYRYAKYKNYDIPAGTDISFFEDSDTVANWAEDALSWAVAEGLICGVGNNTLAPQGNADRAQMATILYRFSQIF